MGVAVCRRRPGFRGDVPASVHRAAGAAQPQRAEAPAREVPRPTPMGSFAADATSALQKSESGPGSAVLRSEFRNHLESDDRPLTPVTTQRDEDEDGDIGDAGVGRVRVGRGTVCAAGCIRDPTAEIRREVDLARRRAVLAAVPAVQINTAKYMCSSVPPS
ncbi:hypothetical protein Vretimale_18639 [Volvox reticuliferus]|uniref:Uncharacterized protein n=1 Tax=Volvox reticuliferus TaxID=1737510 RepID=A0A8J4GYU5_9CHLO|nr:hypothetical protein Vretifemale_16977 [Volvox reticuliferus]GIM15964.1 hypothetical protein Vretimale_18639 [Volvox reticuliferus]